MIRSSGSASSVFVDREIRAARPSAPRDFSHFSAVYRRLAFAVRDSQGPFEDLADWTDAVKRACAQAHIPYTTGAIWTAISHIVLAGLRPTPVRRQPVEAVREPRPWSHAQAADVYGRLLRLRTRLLNIDGEAAHAIPSAATSTPSAIDTFKRDNGLYRQEFMR